GGLPDLGQEGRRRPVEPQGSGRCPVRPGRARAGPARDRRRRAALDRGREGRQPRQVRDDLPRLPGQAPGRLPPAAHRRRGQDRPGAREAVIRRAAAAVALVAPFAAGAPAAGAATVSTPDSCYSSRAPVDYVGPEFPPRPNRKVRLTIKVGTTGGPCGTAVSARRRIFPFAAAPGNWRLQFDTVAKFDATPPRPFVRLIVPVLRNR